MRRERDEAKQALTLVQVAVDQAAAEPSRPKGGRPFAAAAKKKKKRRSAAAVLLRCRPSAPPAEPLAADAVAAMFEAARPAPRQPTVDEPQQHDKLSIDNTPFHRLASRSAGPVLANRSTERASLSPSKIWSKRASPRDARRIVSTVEFEARRAAGPSWRYGPERTQNRPEPADTAAEEQRLRRRMLPRRSPSRYQSGSAAPSLELMARPGCGGGQWRSAVSRTGWAATPRRRDGALEHPPGGQHRRKSMVADRRTGLRCPGQAFVYKAQHRTGYSAQLITSWS